MARRKKEPQSVHRKHIAVAAEQLFLKKGIENTSMNEIAKEAGYSKATLYVYFKNKEELIGFLVLESMQKLYEYISLALQQGEDILERYHRICHALLRYEEEYPFYFKMVLETIDIDFTSDHFLPEEKETFLIGEKINQLLIEFLKEGIAHGEIEPDLELSQTIFVFWGTMSGLIQLAANKEAYIMQQMGRSKEAFLSYGFDMLYQSITAKGGKTNGKKDACDIGKSS